MLTFLVDLVYVADYKTVGRGLSIQSGPNTCAFLVNAAGAGGRTALHGAVLFGLTEIIQFLAEKGTNLDAKEMYGQTPVTMALGDPGGFLAGDNFKEHD